MSGRVVLCRTALALIACSCCWASVQYPKVGRNMTIHYSGELLKELRGPPITKLTIWNSFGMKMPCLQDMGSCTYKGCNGETPMERMIGEPWNNKCPIPAGNYTSKMVFFLHPLVTAVLGNGTFKVKLELTSDDIKVQCRMLNVYIEQ